jgi:hypothetical protein
MMNRSPPNHAAPNASNPTANAGNGSSALVFRETKYSSAHAGAIAKKTVPTNRTRKLEKRSIGY